MSLTFIVIAIFTGILLLNLFLSAYVLLLGARWAKVDQPSFRQSFTAMTLIVVASASCSVLFLRINRVGEETIYEAIFETVVQFAIQIGIIGLTFRISWLRSIQAWLPTMLFGIVFAVGALLLLPFVGTAYFVPTNGMAPTLLGNHMTGKCKQCGEDCYGRHRPNESANSRTYPDDLICEKWHLTNQLNFVGEVGEGDRIYSVSFASPQRWDIAMFKYPADPNQNYAMRIIGLPGETIHIEKGAVFANGEKLTPPDSIQGISWQDGHPGFGSMAHGHKDKPAVLASDEYFVLGDNTAGSTDSRFWNEGAPGHNTFAVPASHIKGVITGIYWPPSRWRSFR